MLRRRLAPRQVPLLTASLPCVSYISKLFEIFWLPTVDVAGGAGRGAGCGGVSTKGPSWGFPDPVSGSIYPAFV